MTNFFKSALFIVLALVLNACNAQNSNNKPASNPTTAPTATSMYKAENEGWLVKMEEAYQLSKKTKKPIMANFTGSDWCGWCKRLTASVFSQDEFKKWAQKNVVLLELDFPRGKQIPDEIRGQNYSLQQAFKVSGYPTVWVFDLEFDQAKQSYNIIPWGQTGYRPTCKEFTTEVDNFLSKRKI